MSDLYDKDGFWEFAGLEYTGVRVEPELKVKHGNKLRLDYQSLPGELD